MNYIGVKMKRLILLTLIIGLFITYICVKPVEDDFVSEVIIGQPTVEYVTRSR